MSDQTKTMIERKPRHNRMIISTILYLFFISLFIFSDIKIDTISIYGMIMLSVSYLFYFSHALLETIYYIKKRPAITLNPEVLTIYTLFSKKTILVKDIQNVTLQMYTRKYLYGIKYIEIKLQHKTIVINDLYKQSIIPLYEKLEEII